MNEQDSFVQEPKTSWAIWIVILVVILFGAFWYISLSRQEESVPEPIAHTTPSPSLDTLQATVINSAIPDYSSQF
jgi:hypothetical protein